MIVWIFAPPSASSVPTVWRKRWGHGGERPEVPQRVGIPAGLAEDVGSVHGCSSPMVAQRLLARIDGSFIVAGSGSSSSKLLSMALCLSWLGATFRTRNGEPTLVSPEAYYRGALACERSRASANTQHPNQDEAGRGVAYWRIPSNRGSATRQNGSRPGCHEDRGDAHRRRSARA